MARTIVVRNNEFVVPWITPMTAGLVVEFFAAMIDGFHQLGIDVCGWDIRFVGCKIIVAEGATWEDLLLLVLKARGNR
jgi:hypothetical protein